MEREKIENSLAEARELGEQLVSLGEYELLSSVYFIEGVYEDLLAMASK